MVYNNGLSAVIKSIDLVGLTHYQLMGACRLSGREINKCASSVNAMMSIFGLWAAGER